jgi:hypothetical protein
MGIGPPLAPQQLKLYKRVLFLMGLAKSVNNQSILNLIDDYPLTVKSEGVLEVAALGKAVINGSLRTIVVLQLQFEFLIRSLLSEAEFLCPIVSGDQGFKL